LFGHDAFDLLLDSCILWLPLDAVEPTKDNTWLLQSEKKHFFGIVFTKRSDFAGGRAITSVHQQARDDDVYAYKQLESARATLAGLTPEQQRLLGLSNATELSLSFYSSNHCKSYPFAKMTGDDWQVETSPMFFYFLLHMFIYYYYYFFCRTSVIDTFYLLDSSACLFWLNCGFYYDRSFTWHFMSVVVPNLEHEFIK
jgi:hypothetical protein